MELREVKFSQAPLGIPIGMSASSRGGGPEPIARGQANSSGGGNIHLCTFWGSATITPQTDGIFMHRSFLWSDGGMWGSYLIFLWLWVLSK